MSRRQVSVASTVVAFGLLAFVTPRSVAEDRHVAITGNDETGTGTAGTPWRTIGRAVDAAQPGDVIVLHNGEYAESVRIRQPNITLMSAANESAVIRSEIGTGDDPKLCVMFDVDASGGALKRLELIGGYYCVFLQTRWDWGGPDRGGASDILIEDCKIHESGRDCIKITPNSDRTTIRRCEIYNSGQMYPPGTPFDDKNAEGIDSTNGDGVLVQDCYVHDTATTGIYFKGGATDCVVERTRVERCGQAGILVGFDTSPEFFDLGANPRYYEAVNGVVRNCIIRDTNYAGIGFYAADGGLAANNTIIDTAKSGHSPIYFGVTLQDYDPAAGRPASRNIRAVNNIVMQPNAASSTAVFIRYLYEPELGALEALEGVPAMSNNLYFVSGATPQFGDARPGSVLDSGDLAAWQAHIAGDMASFVADPLLAADGRLSAGSPAIGRGTSVAGVTVDFDGGARPATASDVGADQYGAASPIDERPTGDAPTGQNPNDNGPVVIAPNGQSASDDAGKSGPAPSNPAPGTSGNDAGQLDLPADSGAVGLCPLTAVGALGLGIMGLRLSGRSATRSGVSAAYHAVAE